MEIADELVIAMDVAGFEDAGLEVDLRAGTICVSGRRAFELPPGTDGRAARVSVHDGVLTIRAPRHEAKEQR